MFLAKQAVQGREFGAIIVASRSVKGKPMNKLTIPVQIDSIKEMEDFQRTRCIYYRVELEDGYVFRKTRYLLNSSAFFAAGVSWAALAGPVLTDGEENEFFLTPELITQTIDSLHDNERLSLDMGYLWIPNSMFQKAVRGVDIREGDVYRLSLSYFRYCYRFTLGKISDEEWLNPKKRFRKPIQPSPKETEAFRLWRQKQIEISHNRYHNRSYARFRLAKKMEAR
jgi:hypothetical protein